MSRQRLIERLAQPIQYDLAVIGGGATGLGVALDAAARGLRYLAQGDIALVREALHERSTLLRNAPHLAQALPMAEDVLEPWCAAAVSRCPPGQHVSGAAGACL